MLIYGPTLHGRFTNDTFIKDDIAINKTGLHMRDSPKMFTVSPAELRVGELIGRGNSSYVQRAIHIPTNTEVALKVAQIAGLVKYKSSQ